MSLMWSLKDTWWGTRKSVIAESGLYVLRGLIGMFYRGVYDIALVNKHIYWSTRIYEKEININFDNKNR